MRPETESQKLLCVARAKAKMREYDVPEEQHIAMPKDPAELLILSIGLLGDQAARISRGESSPSEEEQFDNNNQPFSAYFFDTYLNTHLNESLDPYVALLGASSYYLNDQPGNASVLTKKLFLFDPYYGNYLDLGGEGLDDLLLWLLKGDSFYVEDRRRPFGKLANLTADAMRLFLRTGSDFNKEILLLWAKKIRKTAYDIGSPRQLLLADIINAVVIKKVQNSCWNALPKYSGLTTEQWSPAIRKESFIKELWPAQHLLGQKEVYKGKSAVVQMPTSAGKTKAIELILRSAFLAERASLAVIVAPFRALCHEITNNLTEAFRGEAVYVNEFSDVMQMDDLPIKQADFSSSSIDALEKIIFKYDMRGFEISKQVVVVTPEKLLYVLRQVPKLASLLGLIIFDEGHQFDDKTRGVTYELLLTSLRSMIPAEAQKVLISAVIKNAEAVGQWLNGESNVVEGQSVNPTYRSVGFTGYDDSLGNISYVNPQNIDQQDFCVPNIIKFLKLGRKPRERADRFFPTKTKSNEIALYLGLKLVKNGSVALFCGKKDSVATICKTAVDIFERGVPLLRPLHDSNKEEVTRLSNLHAENLGSNAPASKSAILGIFGHHGNTPHGIRIAIEYAMREDLVHFVVCTSTLAQGVNLPLRYLVIANYHQERERIKVRDFQNLIGRTGRAGMHTEGSILFANPDIYAKNMDYNPKWNDVKELLDQDKSETCTSNLLSIFEPFKNDIGSQRLLINILDFVQGRNEHCALHYHNRFFVFLDLF